MQSNLTGEKEGHNCRNTTKTLADSSAASGNVRSQAMSIVRIMFQRAWPLAIPIPKRAPQETWVVDTGIPHLDANITKKLVTKFAQRP